MELLKNRFVDFSFGFKRRPRVEVAQEEGVGIVFGSSGCALGMVVCVGVEKA